MTGCLPVLDHSVVLTTGNELPGGLDLGGGARKDESILVEESPENGPQEDPISSPVRSFQSLFSSQSSEEGMKEAQMIPYVSPPQTTATIHFKDTLSDENHFQFNLIYESLLVEGWAGNITDLAIDMVLAGKPPTWLPVICERLKHLTISSEAFQKKKRIKYNAQKGTKKLRVGKGKGIGKHSKGIRYLGVSGKEKGKVIGPQKKITKQTVTPPSTVVT